MQESKTKKYKCEYQDCGKEFSRKDHLLVHNRTHTGEKSYKCEFKDCGKSFSVSSHFKKHIRTHTGEKPYKCQFKDCEKVFTGSSNLKRHIKTHSGEKPYKCEFKDCGKAFADSSNFKNHKRIHGEKQKIYKCDLENCNKNYSTKEQFKIHIRRHMGERPYKCNFDNCNKKFYTISALGIHNRIHTKEKPYKCNFNDCNKEFTQGSNLKSHIKHCHTFEKPYKCLDEMCDMHFVTSSEMKSHYKNIHSEEGQKRQKKRENMVYNNIFVKNDINCQREMQIDFKCLYNREEKEDKNNTKFCRIDFYSVMDDFILFTECDENSHMDYDASCEISRMMKIQESMILQGIDKPIIWLRFNPDGFKRDEIRQKIPIRDRVKKVVDFVKTYQPNNDLEIHYFFYDEFKIDEIEYYVKTNTKDNLQNLLSYHF